MKAGVTIKLLITNIIFLCLINKTNAAVRLPRLVSDNMILQRDAYIKLWGWAMPGEKVTVYFINKTYETTAGKDEKWLLTLPKMKAGGPYDMDIRASNQIVLKNILLGDVWICSGQSNMELSMERVKEKYTEVIANSSNSLIRQFNVSSTYNFNAPQQDYTAGSWVSANPSTVLQFTAVGYFFAKTLYEKYRVPIGLIKSAVGGAPAEAWMSEDALQVFPYHLATAKKFKDSAYVDSLRNADLSINTIWRNQVDEKDLGLNQLKPWYDTSYQPQGWPVMKIPGYWNDHGLKGVNGVVWYRKEIVVPASMAGKPAKLFMGRIVDADYVYVNGVLCGHITYQYPPRRYEIPKGLLKAGKNIIVIRVINSAGKGGFIQDKPYYLVAGSETIDLKGEWQFKLGISVPPITHVSTPPQYQPEGLFNGMISPLLNYNIKGVIWYQGETNVGRAIEYQKLFPALIRDWRKHLNNQSLPFLYVQLANFMEAKDQPSESDWAEMRVAQLKALSLPNTAIVVTHDIGEWNDLHPLNKQEVGKRLALVARKIAYADDSVVYSGPLFHSMKIEGSKIIVAFTNTGSGLIAKGDNELHQFAIAGADKNFVWAKARIENNTVIIWNETVRAPEAVRYAWADNPEGANLYNKEGLPASLFQAGKSSLTTDH